MFYCNVCALVRGWPRNTAMRSYGQCDVCKKNAYCNDVRSRDLPHTTSSSDSYTPTPAPSYDYSTPAPAPDYSPAPAPSSSDFSGGGGSSDGGGASGDW